MKTSNLVIIAVLVLTSLLGNAKPIIVDKKTKVVTPARYIHLFEKIDWDQLEEKQDTAKEEATEFHVMMCDDSYSSLVEISFEGRYGKDVVVESDCALEGVQFGEWNDQFMQFHGPDDTCTIQVIKKQNGKTIKMNYELHDAC